MALQPPIIRSAVRLIAAGVMAAACTGAAGWGIARVRLGPTDASALSRLRAELDGRFRTTTFALSARAARLAAAPDTLQSIRGGASAAGPLFQLLDTELAAEVPGASGVTVFAADGSPLAWSGRVSDIPRERLNAPRTLFVVIDASGPRVIHVEPLLDPARTSAPRLGTIVAEQMIGPGLTAPPFADSFLLPTSVADVVVRSHPATVAPIPPYTFTIQAPDGTNLVDVEVTPERLAQTRAGWYAGTRTAVLSVVILTLLLIASLIAAWRRGVRTLREIVIGTVFLGLVLIASRLLCGLALDPIVTSSIGDALRVLVNALLLLALVWLALDLEERYRACRTRRRLHPFTTGTLLRQGATYLIVGCAVAANLWWYERTLQQIAARSPVDLLHFSLHPFDVARLAMAVGLVVLHAGVIWGCVFFARLPRILVRTRTARPILPLKALAAIAGGWLATQVAVPSFTAPVGPLLTALATIAMGAIALDRPRGGIRRSSQAARLGLWFLALVIPAVAMYPWLTAFTRESKERLVAERFAPEASSQREELQSRRLPQALEAIDAIPSLAEFVGASSEDAAPTTDRAFIVWSRTEFANYHITSAVELYGPNGRLISRFAVNLPDYGVPTYRSARCADWDLYEESSPLGSTVRNVLRAGRAICVGQRPVGAIVVRAMLDYRSLPFSVAEGPYLQSLRREPATAPEGVSGRDVEFAAYGWSKAPLFTSGTRVWPLPDAVFDQMVASREPTWADIERDGVPFRVYFFNDRGGIYALGYPVLTGLGHLVNLGELVFLVGAVYLATLVVSTLAGGTFPWTPASGRALLREIRSSFYRKLFIASVASAVVPVVFLALATQRYFANQLRASVEEAAVQTATVVQRLIEDYAALQEDATHSLAFADDQFLLLVRRAIGQDVNLFEGARLQATSARDLFASRLLPTRTPGHVYRRLVIDRQPAAVSTEEIGGLPYLLAAAPVRTGQNDGLVTVPQTLRQAEIEQQIDELDRRILSASLLFILLGAALGYTMAERIADPVNRLSRATRRIARGDLDARIAKTSSDELGRLVEDFNRMADDLKRQRADLQRTQRLEAWADMARQVAHDIKNPLTPIQLSAEHALRINMDQGRPLSPVLDDCVTAILSQVRLLRQISVEFSSFATAPVPHPEPVQVAPLIDEILLPYRAGLTGRVTIETSAAPDLPEAIADRTLFSRALTNVVENAIHAMPTGGRLSVRVAATDDGWIAVEVTDTGVGMDEEALRRVFEPYFSTKATGTGLGLTIAKRNIELIGGTIAASSARGAGTTVTIRIRTAHGAAGSQPS